jgi:hypothetical protein
MVNSNNMDDNASAFSAMTLNTAAKDRHIEKLEAQIRAQQLRSTPEGGSSVGGGGNSYGGRGSGGSRRSGGGRGSGG